MTHQMIEEKEKERVKVCQRIKRHAKIIILFYYNFYSSISRKVLNQSFSLDKILSPKLRRDGG